MNRALHLITTSTTTVGDNYKRESLTITSVQGPQALEMIADLQRDRRTGQVILNMSQGRFTGLQFIEKQVVTK